MSSLLTFMFMAGLVIEAAQGNCFKEGEPQKYLDDEMIKFSAPIEKNCQQDKPSATANETKKCVNDKIDVARKECSASVKNDEKKWWYCYCEKLGVEKPTDEEMTFDFFKKVITDLTLDEKKQIVSDVIDECKSDTNFWLCSDKKLAEGPCPEMKPYYEQIKEWGHMK